MFYELRICCKVIFMISYYILINFDTKSQFNGLLFFLAHGPLKLQGRPWQQARRIAWHQLSQKAGPVQLFLRGWQSAPMGDGMCHDQFFFRYQINVHSVTILHAQLHICLLGTQPRFVLHGFGPTPGDIYCSGQSAHHVSYGPWSTIQGHQAQCKQIKAASQYNVASVPVRPDSAHLRAGFSIPASPKAQSSVKEENKYNRAENRPHKT